MIDETQISKKLFEEFILLFVKDKPVNFINLWFLSKR